MPQPQAPVVFDRDHLDRMTLGDPDLAVEILRLFAVQAAELIQDITNDPAGGGLSAHKLKGSAQAVGALTLEAALTEYEQALAAAGDTSAVIAELKRSLAEVVLAIGATLAEYTRSSADNVARAGVGRNEPL